MHCEGPVRRDVGTRPCFSGSKSRYTHAPGSVSCFQMGRQPLRVRILPKLSRHPFLLALSGCHPHQHVLGYNEVGTQKHRNTLTYLLDNSRGTQNVSPGRISRRSERGCRQPAAVTSKLVASRVKRAGISFTVVSVLDDATSLKRTDFDKQVRRDCGWPVHSCLLPRRILCRDGPALLFDLLRKTQHTLRATPGTASYVDR